MRELERYVDTLATTTDVRLSLLPGRRMPGPDDPRPRRPTRASWCSTRSGCSSWARSRARTTTRRAARRRPRRRSRRRWWRRSARRSATGARRSSSRITRSARMGPHGGYVSPLHPPLPALHVRLLRPELVALDSGPGAGDVPGATRGRGSRRTCRTCRPRPTRTCARRSGPPMDGPARRRRRAARVRGGPRAQPRRSSRASAGRATSS